MKQKVDQALVDFAKAVVNHPAKEKVLTRIDANLLKAFRKGTPEVREEVVKIMDSSDLFFKELEVIIAESVKLNEDLDDE
jgi:hypothetical protein